MTSCILRFLLLLGLLFGFFAPEAIAFIPKEQRSGSRAAPLEKVERYSGLPTMEYVRGSDYGGGIGGILYTIRDSTPSFTHYNHRGDIVSKTDDNGIITYEAQYEAFGTRLAESGTTEDRQKANTKDEDPTGLLNEGFRYRDLETGTFLTRDPLGFVDGPNMYAYVMQNPWTKFDPEGLWQKETAKVAVLSAPVIVPVVAATAPVWGPPVAIGVAVVGTTYVVYTIVKGPQPEMIEGGGLHVAPYSSGSDGRLSSVKEHQRG